MRHRGSRVASKRSASLAERRPFLLLLESFDQPWDNTRISQPDNRHLFSLQFIDDSVLHWVQSHQNPIVNYAARDITSLGGDTLVALITVFVTGALLWTGSTRSALRFLLTMILTATIIVVLKVLIGRPCPIQPDPYQTHLGDFPTAAMMIHLPCMPSGHTCGSVVLYSLVMFLVRDSKPPYFNPAMGWPQLKSWTTGWCIVLPIVIGFTRLYLSAHWFTDVIAGYILGWAIVGLQRWMFSSAAR